MNLIKIFIFVIKSYLQALGAKIKKDTCFLRTPSNSKHSHLDSTSNIPNPIIHNLSLVYVTMVPHLNFWNHLVCVVWMLFIILYGQFFLHSNEGCLSKYKWDCLSTLLKPVQWFPFKHKAQSTQESLSYGSSVSKSLLLNAAAWKRQNQLGGISVTRAESSWKQDI